MPVPTSYTEKSLAEYMHTMLGKVASALNLHFGPNDAGDYAEAVNDALLTYGVTDIASISGVSNIQKLRALARVAAWQYVMNNFTALYDFSADGGHYSRSQLFDQTKQSLGLAEQAALPYAPTYRAKIIPVVQKHDPYAFRPEDESGV